MMEVAFYLLVACQAYSLGTLLLSIVRPDLRMWPLPDPGTRRYRVSRFTSFVGPVALAGVIVLGLLDWNSFVFESPLRFGVGGLLLAIGGGFGMWGYRGLGTDASYGNERDLLDEGAYRYSRNPQSVGSAFGLFGYVLVSNSELALVVWALWTLWFALAPFAEEPWLREKLGAPYEEYTKRTRRYL